MNAPPLRFYLGRTLGALLTVTLLTALKHESSKTRHASILARVLSYELTLAGRVKDRVGIAVVHKRNDAVSEASADDWMQGLVGLSSVKIGDRSIFLRKVPAETAELNSAIDNGAAVLVVAAGASAELPEIAKVARARHVLTVGSNISDIQTFLTVCITEERDKPKIYMNLNTAHLEGIRFSNRLLGVVKLIR